MQPVGPRPGAAAPPPCRRRRSRHRPERLTRRTESVSRRRSGRRPSAGRRRRRSPGGPARAGGRHAGPPPAARGPTGGRSRGRYPSPGRLSSRARRPRWCTDRISWHIRSSESRSASSGWSGTSSICIRNSVGRSSGARNSSHRRRPPKPSGPIMARHWRCRSACVRSGGTSWTGRRGGMSSSMSRSLSRTTPVRRAGSAGCAQPPSVTDNTRPTWGDTPPVAVDARPLSEVVHRSGGGRGALRRLDWRCA